MSRDTERLARELVRADVRLRAAYESMLWDEASVWEGTREDLRQLRSDLMRRQMASGEWWTTRIKDAA